MCLCITPSISEIVHKLYLTSPNSEELCNIRHDIVLILEKYGNEEILINNLKRETHRARLFVLMVDALLYMVCSLGEMVILDTHNKLKRLERFSRKLRKRNRSHEQAV